MGPPTASETAVARGHGHYRFQMHPLELFFIVLGLEDETAVCHSGTLAFGMHQQWIDIQLLYFRIVNH